MTADELMRLVDECIDAGHAVHLGTAEDDLRDQIKAEVTRLHAEADALRVQLAHWRVFGEHAEGERSRLQLEVQALRVNARLNGQP